MQCNSKTAKKYEKLQAIDSCGGRVGMWVFFRDIALGAFSMLQFGQTYIHIQKELGVCLIKTKCTYV